MLSYKAISVALAPALKWARASSLVSPSNSATAPRPYQANAEAAAFFATPWAVSFGWPGHDDSSSARPAAVEIEQSPEPLPERSNIKSAMIGTGFAALILAVAILNQQIVLAVLSTLERVGHSAEIQGALAKPLSEMVATIFQ